MKDIIPAKKQSPILGLTGMGGGVGSNIVAGGAKKTYVEDVFSNWTYRGNNQATQSEQNGIDLVDKGGFAWIKDCDAANNHVLFDTERGVGNMLRLGGTTDGNETVSNGMWAPASNGFTHGNWDGIGQAKKYASWTWAKQEGFFDVIKWTGNGVSGRQIPHNLGSVPGFVMTKALDNSDGWRTLHSYDFSKVLYISGNSAAQSSAQSFTGTVCDATHLTVTADGSINASGQEYIAYIFAGGPSAAATAKSVYGSSSAYINTTTSSTDFSFGTGDFTIEFWVKPKSAINNKGIFQLSSISGGLASGGNWNLPNSMALNVENTYTYTPWGNIPKCQVEQWQHIAISRNSGTTTVYFNGIKSASGSDTNNYTYQYIVIGGYWDANYLLEANISNFRIVKGTAVYTSSFTPPTEPLTNISGTVLLCCNDSSSATGATVTPVTLNNVGSCTASTESPFLDPEGYKFGDDADQNLIECGIYKGDTTTLPEIHLGWEPQFLMIKAYSSTTNWTMFDNIRGMVGDGGDDYYLYPNLANTEALAERLEVTPRGFKITASSSTIVNGNTYGYVYVAIRRPDPLVSKAITAGTDALFMATGDGNNGTVPKFRTSDFPVDFMMMKTPATSNSWLQSSRLSQKLTITSDSNSGQVGNTNIMFDYMNGWGSYTSNDLSSWDGWGFRRHAGMDVVTYKGNGASHRVMPHNLTQAPEMIWIKNVQHNNTVWVAGHKGLNGGTNPWDYWIRISGGTQAESTDGGIAWGGTAPTSTHFSIGSWTEVNNSSYEYIAFLFSSVTGVSKLGYYTGDDTTDGSKVITTGFQPRFLMVKCVSNAGENWNIVDSHRGLGAGNDKTLKLNAPDAQNTADVVDVSSTGFSLRAASGDWNAINYRYIYYAHA